MKFIKKKIKKVISNSRRTHYRILGYYPANFFGNKLKLNFERFEFWEKAIKGRWEPQTFDILSKYLNQESIYFDIGAWIGPTVIYAANRCKKVVCFEPDPVAFRILMSNIQLNNLNNISAFNFAISDKNSIQTMSNFGGNPGNSKSTLLKNEMSALTSFDILVVNWDFVESIFDMEKVTMIKIDIEGGEFSLIPMMKEYLKRYKPILWLSIHAPFLENHTRLQEVNNLISILTNCYSTCLNSSFEKMDINDLANEKNMNSFPEFLFK